MVLKALHDDGVLSYYYDECVDFSQIVEDFDIIRLENQIIALAMDVVEKRLRNGTASSQETTHFLKLGSIKERRELLLLEQEIELKKAKTESIKSAERVEELYKEALNAMRTYSGANRKEDDDD